MRPLLTMRPFNHGLLLLTQTVRVQGERDGLGGALTAQKLFIHLSTSSLLPATANVLLISSKSLPVLAVSRTAPWRCVRPHDLEYL
ncbi:hypothetical protein HDV63DRAFT_390797 [Trichoderma sp. SZMC 28014]